LAGQLHDVLDDHQGASVLALNQPQFLKKSVVRSGIAASTSGSKAFHRSRHRGEPPYHGHRVLRPCRHRATSLHPQRL
jgi:hypothetical protein